MKLEVKEVSCGYSGKAILNNLTVEIYSGEILCILGPNGVGKTTLFKTIMNFLPPVSGNITLNGQDIGLWPKRKLARHLGYVPQAHVPPFPFSVIDVVTMGKTANLGAFSSPSARDIMDSEESLELLGIGGLKDRIYTELSGGERQMVLIARALTQNPDIILMDEPTSNLDFGNQVRVLERINELAGKGLAIVMTSHVPDHAFLCSAKTALLCGDGNMRTGSADEIITEENLNEAYGVGVKIFESVTEDGNRIKSCVPLLGKRCGESAANHTRRMK
jgi:iron complex transport system ATP-binding protein